MRISDWSSDVCSSDLKSKQASIYSTDDSCSDSVSDVFKQYAISIGCFPNNFFALDPNGFAIQSFWPVSETKSILDIYVVGLKSAPSNPEYRSEEHTSELQSLMRNSYAVFCLKQQNNKPRITTK